MLGWETIYIVIEASSQEIKRKMFEILFCHTLLNNWSLAASRWVIFRFWRGKSEHRPFQPCLCINSKTFCWLANPPPSLGHGPLILSPPSRFGWVFVARLSLHVTSDWTGIFTTCDGCLPSDEDSVSRKVAWVASYRNVTLQQTDANGQLLTHRVHVWYVSYIWLIFTVKDGKFR